MLLPLQNHHHQYCTIVVSEPPVVLTDICPPPVQDTGIVTTGVKIKEADVPLVLVQLLNNHWHRLQ
jgi:hypothetical protein